MLATGSLSLQWFDTTPADLEVIWAMSVVIEFEDMDAARGFYESEAYTAARAVRETAAETDLMLVEGV